MAGLAPAGPWRDRAASLDADVFLAQVQNIIDPVKYGAKVCDIRRRFDGIVIAELSANNRPGHTAAGLLRQWRAGRACASRFAVWGWEENLVTAQAFMDRAIAEDA